MFELKQAIKTTIDNRVSFEYLMGILATAKETIYPSKIKIDKAVKVIIKENALKIRYFSMRVPRKK